MKDVYENPVFAQWRDRDKEGDVTRQWIIDQVLPEMGELLATGHAVLEPSGEGPILRAIENGRIYYPVPDTMPDGRELFAYIIGAAALDYGSQWWDVQEWIGVDENGNVEPDWSLRVAFGADGDTEDGIISPGTLAQAIMRIKSGVIPSMSPELVKDCGLLAAGQTEDIDIDAIGADLIMQVAITGDDAIYG